MRPVLPLVGRFPLALVVTVLCGVLGLAEPAAAHKLFVFATVRGKMIEGEVYYQGGDPAPDINVAIIGPEDMTLEETKTDQEGRFRFEPRWRIDHLLAADAGFGHRSEYTVLAAELPPDLPSYVSDGATSSPASTADRSSEAGRSPSSGPPGTATEIEALNQQIAALRRDLDRWKAQLRMQDILGGIGYILGVMGLTSYLLRKRKPSSQIAAR
jgi:nickel transport protein